MADFDYGATAQDALEALAEFGALTTVTYAAPPPADDYDPETSSGAAPSASSVTAFGAIFDYSGREYGDQPDSLIRAGDRQLLLAAIDVNGAPIAVEQAPIEAAVVGPDGAPYIIKNVRALGPAGVVVLFDITVRRP